MPLDGLFLNRLTNELAALVVGGRVDKIHQPARETLIISIRAAGGNRRLLLCTNAGGPRIHLTSLPPDNPASPPMFCMLLRKRLGGAKIVSLTQDGLDRVVRICFDTTNEFGDHEILTLYAEMMGRTSNLILVAPDGRIIDSVKRVNTEMSRVRPVLPGMDYVRAPSRDRLDIRAADMEQIMSRISLTPELPLSKALGGVFEGMSPLICREISYQVCRGTDDIIAGELDEQAGTRLKFYLAQLSTLLESGGDKPTMLLDKNETPKDYSFIDIHQYGYTLTSRFYDSYSEMLDNFYSERDRLVKVRQRGGDLLRLLVTLSERTSRKLALQKSELETCAQRGQLKTYGDLINANLYALEKGMRKAVLQNFYEPDAAQVEIPLDAMLTPAQNAQKYYHAYRKADTAEKKLLELISQGEAELEYFDSVLDALSRASQESELSAVRAELASQGYVKNSGNAGKRNIPDRLAPLRYVSDDDFTILCGRNNLQNDRLTLKDSRRDDVWLHTQKIPGSHVIIQSQGREIPPRTLEQAAVIAACNSKASDAGKVAVDYTEVKNVRKHPAGRPGLVLYEPYKTVIVQADKQLAARLADKNAK